MSLEAAARNCWERGGLVRRGADRGLTMRAKLAHQGPRPPSPAAENPSIATTASSFISSLSKTLGAGPAHGIHGRAGRKLIPRSRRALRRLMIRPSRPPNNQRTVAMFLADGHHDALLAPSVQCLSRAAGSGDSPRLVKHLAGIHRQSYGWRDRLVDPEDRSSLDMNAGREGSDQARPC